MVDQAQDSTLVIQSVPSPDDICPRPEFLAPGPTTPLAPPIHLSAVYRCDSPAQAEAMLAGDEGGYVYARDGHPNADLLAEKCRALHGMERAAICASGMGALAVACLALLNEGDHVIASNRLYGRSLKLLSGELPRIQRRTTVVDTCDLAATEAAFQSSTKLLVVETITNPTLRVSDIAALAELAHRRGALLLVDNTLAGPTVCRPAELGADLVHESLTKIMNGHSDVVLGLLCGRQEHWQRLPDVVSTWGLAASPFDCWLAARGLATLAVRSERACQNAMRAAEFLRAQPQVAAVHYPSLPDHSDHAIAKRQFGGQSGGQFGNMVTFTLRGGLAAATRFIAAAKDIPFAPSLGDLSTTLSHPASTSHRNLSLAEQTALGIHGGTIRLSIGIESPEAVVAAIRQGLSTT